MDGMRFTYAVHLHGTLAADARGEFKLPCGASLVAVSVGASNAAASTLSCGIAGTRTGILNGKACGQSGAPVSYEPSSFNGNLADGVAPYRLPKGAIFTWDLDFDGPGSTPGQNVAIVFTFLEG